MDGARAEHGVRPVRRCRAWCQRIGVLECAIGYGLDVTGTRRRLPLLAALAAEAMLGEREVRLRLRARIEQLWTVTVVSAALCVAVGYQVATRQRQLLTWWDRLAGLRRTREAPPTSDDSWPDGADG